MENDGENFLSQIREARSDMQEWPEWMREASQIYAAVVPDLAGKDEISKPAHQMQGSGEE